MEKARSLILAEEQRQRIVLLERLVRDYRAFADDLTRVACRPRITFGQRDELAKRANDLLGDAS